MLCPAHQKPSRILLVKPKPSLFVLRVRIFLPLGKLSIFYLFQLSVSFFALWGLANCLLAVDRTPATFSLKSLSLSLFLSHRKKAPNWVKLGHNFQTQFNFEDFLCVWKSNSKSHISQGFVWFFQLYNQYYYSPEILPRLKITVISFYRWNTLKFGRFKVFTWSSLSPFHIHSMSQHVIHGNFVSIVMQCDIWSIKCKYIKLFVNNIKTWGEHLFEDKSFCKFTC